MPPEISPLVGSITAPSLGLLANANVPPTNPVTIAVAPSQFGVNSNVESLGFPKLIFILS